jgi:two-component system, chemotaxis family, CheB/CheR fusion protein
VTDTIARVGGDEFAILLPQTELEGAEMTTAKLVAAIRSSEWHVYGSTIAATISAGIAVTNGIACTPAGLSDAADKPLYRAKTGGGNRRAIAPPPISRRLRLNLTAGAPSTSGRFPEPARMLASWSATPFGLGRPRLGSSARSLAPDRVG